MQGKPDNPDGFSGFLWPAPGSVFVRFVLVAFAGFAGTPQLDQRERWSHQFENHRGANHQRQNVSQLRQPLCGQKRQAKGNAGLGIRQAPIRLRVWGSEPAR